MTVYTVQHNRAEKGVLKHYPRGGDKPEQLAALRL